MESIISISWGGKGGVRAAALPAHPRPLYIEMIRYNYNLGISLGYPPESILPRLTAGQYARGEESTTEKQPKNVRSFCLIPAANKKFLPMPVDGRPIGRTVACCHIPGADFQPGNYAAGSAVGHAHAMVV